MQPKDESRVCFEELCDRNSLSVSLCERIKPIFFKKILKVDRSWNIIQSSRCEILYLIPSIFQKYRDQIIIIIILIEYSLLVQSPQSNELNQSISSGNLDFMLVFFFFLFFQLLLLKKEYDWSFIIILLLEWILAWNISFQANSKNLKHLSLKTDEDVGVSWLFLLRLELHLQETSLRCTVSQISESGGGFRS